jgi:hypothetical protein
MVPLSKHEAIEGVQGSGVLNRQHAFKVMFGQSPPQLFLHTIIGACAHGECCSLGSNHFCVCKVDGYSCGIEYERMFCLSELCGCLVMPSYTSIVSSRLTCPLLYFIAASEVVHEA